MDPNNYNDLEACVEKYVSECLRRGEVLIFESKLEGNDEWWELLYTEILPAKVNPSYMVVTDIWQIPQNEKTLFSIYSYFSDMDPYIH